LLYNVKAKDLKMLKPLKKISKAGIAGLLLILLTGPACDYKSEALGVPDGIYVFADSVLWEQVGKDVELTFNNFIYTPRAERRFELQWHPLSDLNGLNERMNILFVGTTQPGNEVNDYLLQSLPQQFIDQVNQNRAFYFFQDDLFARGQIAMFMMAPTAGEFNSNFQRVKDEIYNTFEEKYFARLKKSMYEKREQEETEEYLASEYGYAVRVQHDYFLATQNPENKYVWLRRINPDRWLSIWRVQADSSMLTKDSLMAIRNAMTYKYYAGDSVVTEESYVSIVDFHGERTRKMVGTWKNDSLFVGGPFRMYAIHKPDENAFYMLDIAVMAPDKKKKPFLDQLEVIASTFRFADEAEAKNKETQN